MPTASRGFSRLFLKVDWATDVIAGWSAGVVITLLSITLYDRNRRRRRTDASDIHHSPSRSLT